MHYRWRINKRKKTKTKKENPIKRKTSITMFGVEK